MNWQMISTICEVVGVLTVIVTLIYLARQLRQNNELLKEQATYNMLQNQLSYYDGMAREPNLVNVVYNIPESDIEATVRAKAESHATAEFFRWHWEYLRFVEEILPEKDMPIDGFRREWDRANFQQYWQEQKHIFDPRFVKFIDGNIVQRANT